MRELSPGATMFKTLKGLTSLAAGTAAVIPAVDYFKETAPPFFQMTSLLTGGVALAILLTVMVHGKPRKNDASRALLAVITALVLTVVYNFGNHYWTVGPPPQHEGARIQTGFHLAAWSLTPEARESVALHRTRSKEELMLAFGAYGPGLPVERVWEMWSVVAAGLILSLAYASSFILWTYGFALYGRSFPSRKRAGNK